MQRDHGPVNADVVHLPSPTIWPMVLALGISLILAGMVTHLVVGLLGMLLTVMSSIGWFGQVFPREQHESIPIKVEEVQIASSRSLMERLPTSEVHRKILPIETFHVVTGIKGGIAGGIAMTVPAALFSFLRYHSIWYATNLLAAGGFVSWSGKNDAFFSAFHLEGLIAAIMIHGLTSLLVGLLYGALLPMFPRHPIITAGMTVPLLFTGIIHSALGIVSPILNERIDWFWFVISQITFGLVCGYVVNRHAKIRTPQFRALPFAVRAGIQSDQGGSLEQGRSANEKDTPQ
jgi:hypothetical protein